MAAKLKVDHLDENSIRARETNTSANVMPKSSLTIMIMNTGTLKKKVENRKEKRKQAICEIVTNTGATLFLLQEFTWKGIRSKHWKEFRWPEHLQYTGHNDSEEASLCIIFDDNKVTTKEYSATVLKGTLEELQRIGRIQQGFSPIPRMCLRKVNTKEVPVLSFICISWHGRHNCIDDVNKMKEFECLMEYVLKLSEKEALPVIIGGDFNVNIKDIEHLVPDSLILHRYTPTARRNEKEIIDFYISSRSLVMSDMKALKWESETKVDDVLLVFDHDPVITSVTPDEAKGYKLAVKSSNAPQRESQTKVDDVQSVFHHDPVVTSLTTNEAKGYKLVVKSKSAKLKVAHLDENSIRARETNTSANVMPKSSLMIMIMNTPRKKKKHSVEKATEKRKQAIYDIVTNTGATLVLLQEFEWADSKECVEFNWPERLQYTGHKDASIIYDVNEVTIEEYSRALLDDTLRELHMIGSIQQEFSPFPRMCIKKIKTKVVPVISFICISWHGPYKGKKLDDRKKEFKCLLEYVLELSEKEALPVIIGGDFNVKIKDIEKLVPRSLKLHRYTPTGRRKNNIIDFFISSESLVMSDVKALKWDSQTNVDDVLLLFHDPVVTSVTTGETKGYNLDVKSSNAPQRRRPHTNRNTSRLVTPPVDRCVLSSPVDGQNHSIQRLHTTSVHHIPSRRHNTDAHNESCCRYCGERNHSSKNCKNGTYWQCILI